MSRVYKTAKGKMVDMDQVKLSNENVIAVGNMKVNARGDKLGPGGEVVATRNQIMDQVYAVDHQPVGQGYSPNDPEVHAQQQENEQARRAQELHELSSNLVTESPNVQPTAPSAPAARGSLASSVAKTATVTQTPLPKPGRPSGPSRI
jgi:hypothetical protein